MVILILLIEIYIYASIGFYLIAILTYMNNYLFDKFQVNIKIVFKDFWIGIYIDAKNKKCYLSMLPMIIVIVDFQPDKITLYLNRLKR